MPRACDHCNEELGDMKCAGCGKACYCGKICQRKSWHRHKFECNAKRGPTTADHLYLACISNEIPKDKQTLIDFGFQRAFTAYNQSRLLGLYIGITQYNNVSAKELHRWRERGTLIDEIKNVYEARPANNRGYYPWFLQNHWVLDGKTPEEWGQHEAEQELAKKVARAGWLFTGGSKSATDSQIQDAVSRWPREKQECWFLCGSLLTSSYPGPDTDAWITFAFCTCEDAGSEQSLARLYQRLLALTTFDQFLLAYESSQLYALFQSTHLSRLIGFVHPLVEGVLQTSPHNNLSVWDLKRFTLQEMDEDEDATHRNIIPPVGADYGFSRCATLEELKDLKSVYKTLFSDRQCKPMDLHEACIQGHLYEYVRKQVKLTGNSERYKRILSNVHPLSGPLAHISGTTYRSGEINTSGPLPRDPHYPTWTNLAASTTSTPNMFTELANQRVLTMLVRNNSSLPTRVPDTSLIDSKPKNFPPSNGQTQDDSSLSQPLMRLGIIDIKELASTVLQDKNTASRSCTHELASLEDTATSGHHDSSNGTLIGELNGRSEPQRELPGAFLLNEEGLGLPLDEDHHALWLIPALSLALFWI